MARGGDPARRAAPGRGGPGGRDGGAVRLLAAAGHPTLATDERTPSQLAEPPTWLNDRELPIIEPPAVLYQCHSLKRNRGPLNFNPTRKGRFNAPDGEYGTTYLSTTPEGAFVEKMVQEATRDPTGRPVVTRNRLHENCLCAISFGTGGTSRSLRLVDLSGEGAVLIGATGELSSLSDIDRLPMVRRWALRLYEHRGQPDGIYYRARHDQSRISIALFDRARGVLTATCAVNLLADALHLNPLLHRYDVTVIEDTAVHER